MLVLRALGIGDLATGVPALRALRRRHAGELWLAAPSWLAPLVELVGAVDRQVPASGLRPSRWPAPPGQVAVNLHGRGPQSHRLLASADPVRMLGFACPAAGHTDGPPWREDEHEVRRWCRLLEWYGIPADPDDLSLRIPPAAGVDGATIVHPGAKSPARRWPPERFAQVARALAADGHHVVVTGSSGERSLAARVVHLADLPPAAVAAGRTGLAELAAMVARARLVISGDTGVGHLATAYGTPSVLLFGPVPPWWWGPPADRPWHRVLWHEPAWRVTVGHTPGPAAALPHPALAGVTAPEVLDAARVAERRTGRRSPASAGPAVPLAGVRFTARGAR